MTGYKPDGPTTIIAGLIGALIIDARLYNSFRVEWSKVARDPGWRFAAAPRRLTLGCFVELLRSSCSSYDDRNPRSDAICRLLHSGPATSSSLVFNAVETAPDLRIVHVFLGL